MANQPSNTYRISLTPGRYWNLELPVSDEEGFYIFQVSVKQPSTTVSTVLQDVGILVMDDDNFKSWEYGRIAVAAGARAPELPTTITIISGKLSWGTISFKPQSLGLFHLVVENIYQTPTTKEITVDVYWIPYAWGARQSVRQVSRALNWMDEWRLLELSEKDLQNGRLSNCCDNMRKALVLFWVKVAESLSKKHLNLDAGKSPDISMLKAALNPYVPDYIIAELSQVWALASELAHIEKRGGKEPPLNEVLYVHRLVFSSVAFLVSVVPAPQVSS